MLCSDFISLQESSCNLPVILPPLFPFIPLSQSISHPLNTIQIYLSINLKHILYYQLPQQWIPSTFNLNYAYWIIPTLFRTEYYRPPGPINMLPKNNSRLSPLPRLTPDAAQATAETLRMRKPRSDRRDATPKPSPKFMPCPVIILCFVFCHFCYPISPDQDHKPRGRASGVSTISTCFFLYVMIYCPLPHQSLWERLGVSLSCTCAAFSPLC